MQLHRAGTGFPNPVAVAVALVDPLGAAERVNDIGTLGVMRLESIWV